MDETELKRRVLDNLPGGRRKFAVLLLFLVEAVIGGVISWAVPKILNRWCPTSPSNPGPLGVWALKRQIRKECEAAARTPEAQRLGLTADELHGEIGEDVLQALLATGRQLGEDQIQSLRSSCGAS